MKLSQRPRRNRRTESIREMVAESSLEARHLIYPVFICEGKKQKQAISSMPGQCRWSLDELEKIMPSWLELGLRAFALFPQISSDLKNPKGSESVNPAGLLPTVVQRLKKKFPEIVLITDVALDPYSSDGHDGIVRNGEILNDETVELLCQMALLQAQVGSDFVAPSDMMDGRVRALRESLDKQGFEKTGILAYSAKYASGFYGPFREALESAPKAGDKKTYQMDPRNSREALREISLDLREGADIVMVKPALSYLDIIQSAKKISNVPIAAYNVSGEYAMVKAAAQAGWIDEKKVTLEILTSIRRAGADLILSYHAPEALMWLKE